MSEPVEYRAGRRGRLWVVNVAEYGVYAYGRTLKAVHDNTAAALELVDVVGEITIVADTPALEKLRAADASSETALREAVADLALRRISLGDMAKATRRRIPHIKRILAERASVPPENPADVEAAAPPTSEDGELEHQFQVSHDKYRSERVSS